MLFAALRLLAEVVLPEQTEGSDKCDCSVIPDNLELVLCKYFVENLLVSNWSTL